MKFIYLSTAILSSLALATSANAAFTLAGVYDPDDANNVDQSGTFNSATGSASAANVLTVSDFSSSVSTAFSAGTGGIINFDTEGDAFDAAGTLSGTTTGGTTLTFGATAGDAGLSPTTSSGSRIVTSGVAALGQSGNNTGSAGDPGFFGSGSFIFDNFTLSGAPEGTAVTSFGATLVHRLANRTHTTVATFSDGSTLTFDTVTFTTTDTANSLDTFFGVTAPDGLSITQVVIQNNEGGSNSWVDDIGFITTSPIPEPSSTALLGLGGIALLARRKRA